MDVSEDGTRVLFERGNSGTWRWNSERGFTDTGRIRGTRRQFVVQSFPARTVIATLPGEDLIDAVFVPKTSLVLVKRLAAANIRADLWDLSNGGTRFVHEAPLAERHTWIHKVAFLNPDDAVATAWDGNRNIRGEVLYRFSIRSRERSRIGFVDPSDSQRILLGRKMAVSPGGRLIAYAVDGAAAYGYAASRRIIVRPAARPDDVVAIASDADEFFDDEVLFAPDGDSLMAVTLGRARPGVYRTVFDAMSLLVYDTTRFRLISRSQLHVTGRNVTGVFGIAVSPDGRTVAIGIHIEERRWTGRVERAEVILCDLATGVEVARAVHYRGRVKRDDPFVAMIQQMAFTASGELLVSGTEYTSIWRMPSAARQDDIRE